MKKRVLALLMILGMAAVVVSLVACGGGGGEDELTPPPTPVASFAGVYSGTYVGADSGTVTVTLATDGSISGSGSSTANSSDPYQFTISGQVAAGGKVSLHGIGSAGTAAFTGTVTAQGVLSGTWSEAATGSGTFTTQKQDMTPTPDFSLTATSTVTAAQEGFGTATISTTVTGGFNTAVVLTASGLPTGATAAFSPISIAAPGSGSATLTLNAGVLTPAGTHSVTVTGTGGSKTHSAIISFTVTAGGGSTTALFSDGFESGGWLTEQVSGTTGSWSMVGAGIEPPAQPHGGVMLANFNSYTAPSGNQTRLYRTSGIDIPDTIATATLSFWMYHDTDYVALDQVQVQVSTNGTSWVNLGAPVCRYDGTMGWAQVSIDVSDYKGQTLWLGFVGISTYGNDIYIDDVVVAPQEASSADFSLAAPSVVTVAQGGSGTATISSTVTGGFNSAVVLTANGLPSGATATFSPTSIAAPGSGSATLTLAAGVSTPTGSYSITVTGTGGAMTHITTISFKVSAPLGLATLTITPVSTIIAVGSSQQYTASGILSDGTATTLGTLTWTSSTLTTANIDSSGFATGLSEGSSNISASSEGITSNTAVLTVTAVSTATPILVSSNAVGVAGNNTSGLHWDHSSISADGRYAVFTSDADNLVPDDTNQLTDIFYKDLTTGAIQRIFINDRNVGVGYSISADGRQVMFATYRNNLVDRGFLGNTITSGDNNNARDIYVMDMSTGTIRLASSTAAGLSPSTVWNGFNVGSLSADGRYVVFDGSPSELGLGLRGNILVKDLQNGAIRIVDTNAAGTPSKGIASYPVISADGRYVVFISSGSDLVAGDTNTISDVFRKDLQTGTIALVSTSAAGVQGNAGGSYDGAPQVSADGRYVVFASFASNLVASDTNESGDIFYKDMQTGAIQLVTVTASGMQDNVACARPSISADGRYVAFYSQSRALSPSEDLSKAPINVFVKDMQTGELKRASFFPSDADGFYQSSVGQVTADGKYVLIETSYNPLSGYHPEYGNKQILRVPNPFTNPEN